ncbi:hypothetical protein GCM10029963_76510 [Micromonospora andamanensis]
MTILTVAVVVLAVLVVADLAVTFAALRRLREYGEQLTTAQPASPPSALELLGRDLPEVDVTTLDGVELAAEQLRGRPWLIGFFSATCAPCRDAARGSPTTTNRTGSLWSSPTTRPRMSAPSCSSC